MSRKIKIIISIIAVISVGVIGYNYVLYGGERNLTTETTDFTITSTKIASEFSENIQKSNKKYLEKAVAISGTITNVNGLEVIVDNSIICYLKNPDSTVKKGEIITIKGRVVGYDDLMGELKLDQCFIIN
jgi:hypothetical protein